MGKIREFHQYTTKALNKAIAETKKGMKVMHAALKNKIPRSTLTYKSRGERPRSKMGPKPYLKEEYENTLVTWILELKKRGFPVSPDYLADSVKVST